MTRQEFTRKIKLAAFERANGCCEGCGAKLRPGNIEYDHIIPCELGGDGTLDNCQVLCVSCHRGVGAKTADDAGRIAKARRVHAKHIGAHRPKATILGSKASKWKRKIDGSTVRRDE